MWAHTQNRKYKDDTSKIECNTVKKKKKSQLTFYHGWKGFFRQKLNSLVSMGGWFHDPLSVVFSCSAVSDSLRPHGLYPTRLLCPWGFSRQEYWSGSPFPSARDLPDPETEPRSPSLAVRFFTFWATREVPVQGKCFIKKCLHMANPPFTFWNFLKFIFKYFWSTVGWICGYRNHWYGNLTIFWEKYTKHREMLKKKNGRTWQDIKRQL